MAEEEEKEDEHKRGWDFVNLSPREKSGFEWKQSNRTADRERRKKKGER